MPTLIVRARNICGAPSPFWLQGIEKRSVEPDEETRALRELGWLVAEMKDAGASEWFEVVNIRSDGAVDPGAEIEQTAEVDYDLRPLVWGVPIKEMRGRFVLLELRWGEHNLLKEAGRV